MELITIAAARYNEVQRFEVSDRPTVNEVAICLGYVAGVYESDIEHALNYDPESPEELLDEMKADGLILSYGWNA